MPSNTTIPSAASNPGDAVVTRQITHDGDTAKLAGSFIMGIAGSEDSYTAAAINGDATFGLDVDVTRVSGTVAVDGSGVTQPISAASLPLPTGAATAANQTTGNTSLATLAGAVSGTELQVDVLTMPTVTISDGGGSITVDGTVAVSGSVAVTDGGGSLTIDDGGSSLTVDGAVSISGAVTVDPHAVTNAGTFAVQAAASATITACDPHFDSDGDNTAQTIKASSGRLYALEVQNINTADAWIQLYDESGAITVGTTAPKQSYLVPAGDGVKYGAFDRVFPIPMSFANTIKYACTTTPTGSGDPSTGLIVNALYK